MAHEVTFRTKKLIHLGGPQDIKFVIKTDGQKMGELYVGKGGIQWKPKKYKNSKEQNVGWTEFNRRMQKGK